MNATVQVGWALRTSRSILDSDVPAWLIQTQTHRHLNILMTKISLECRWAHRSIKVLALKEHEVQLSLSNILKPVRHHSVYLVLLCNQTAAKSSQLSQSKTTQLLIVSTTASNHQADLGC